jgi:hypothetical protein
MISAMLGLYVMIVKSHTNSTVTRWGLQIGKFKGTVAYCSDGLNLQLSLTVAYSAFSILVG